MTLTNQVGALSQIATIIAHHEANINNLHILEQDKDFCDLQLDVEVRDAPHVQGLLEALRACALVVRCDRFIG